MSTKEETIVTGGTKLLALSVAVGLSSVAELTAWVELITKIVLCVYAISLLGLLWWKNYWRGWADRRGLLDKYPWLRRNEIVIDPKETEPAPLPKLPKA